MQQKIQRREECSRGHVYAAVLEPPNSTQSKLIFDKNFEENKFHFFKQPEGVAVFQRIRSFCNLLLRHKANSQYCPPFAQVHLEH